MWRSLVARIVRDDEVAGSNPVTPTIVKAALTRSDPESGRLSAIRPTLTRASPPGVGRRAPRRPSAVRALGRDRRRPRRARRERGRPRSPAEVGIRPRTRPVGAASVPPTRPAYDLAATGELVAENQIVRRRSYAGRGARCAAPPAAGFWLSLVQARTRRPDPAGGHRAGTPDQAQEILRQGRVVQRAPPYPGTEHLTLADDQRRTVCDRIGRLVHRGYPVLDLASAVSVADFSAPRPCTRWSLSRTDDSGSADAASAPRPVRRVRVLLRQRVVAAVPRRSAGRAGGGPPPAELSVTGPRASVTPAAPAPATPPPTLVCRAPGRGAPSPPGRPRRRAR